jgi:uncharacterized membrane protein
MAKKKVRKKERNKKEANKKDDSKVFAFIAAFFTIIGFLIAIILKKDDKYVMYYAKQGLVLFIAAVIICIVAWIPIMGGIIAWILWVCLAILWIVTWIYSLSGEMKKTWLISDLAEKIKM